MEEGSSGQINARSVVQMALGTAQVPGELPLEGVEATGWIGDRILIFTQFTEMGNILRQHPQEAFGREVLFLHGSVPKKTARSYGGAVSDGGKWATRLSVIPESRGNRS